MFNRLRNLLLIFMVLTSLLAGAKTLTLLKDDALMPAAATSDPPKDSKADRPSLDPSRAVIWKEPADIKSRDLFYGPGGKDHLPKGKLEFIQEKMNGVNPKFDVRDQDGTRLGVKFGREARPETAATRLVWVVGFFTNEDYYIAELPIGSVAQRMKRVQNLIENGKIEGARLKRHNKGEHDLGDWSWDNNPFIGTKELDGLKVMMELICNVDLTNQHVYSEPDGEQRYIAADLGSSFGMAGKTMFYTKGKLKDYQSKPLIKNAGPDFIDFWRFKHITREHAKWIGGYLVQLSDEQISDAFRAAGLSPEEVTGFTQKVREKINELAEL